MEICVELFSLLQHYAHVSTMLSVNVFLSCSYSVVCVTDVLYRRPNCFRVLCSYCL